MCILRHHSSFISRILSIQSLTSGRLVFIAATTHKLLPALTHPLVFNPCSSKWYYGPPFSSPQRWCVAGSINGGINVATGIGAQNHGEVARSMERWDMSKNDVDWHWETRASFTDGRFSREAVEALGYIGKLGKGVKEGAIYDVVMNQWQEMPRGMLDGWNGPAAVDNDSMYVVAHQLKGKKFFGGDTIGYLDIAFGWMANMISILEETAELTLLDTEIFPLLSAWMNNFSDDPTIKES